MNKEKQIEEMKNPCQDCDKLNMEFADDCEYGCDNPCNKAKAFWKVIDKRLDKLLEKIKTALKESEDTE